MPLLFLFGSRIVVGEGVVVGIIRNYYLRIEASDRITEIIEIVLADENRRNRSFGIVDGMTNDDGIFEDKYFPDCVDAYSREFDSEKAERYAVFIDDVAESKNPYEQDDKQQSENRADNFAR